MRAPAQLPPRPPPGTPRRQSTNPFLYLSSVFNPSSWIGNEGSSEGIGNTAGDGQDITQQGYEDPLIPAPAEMSDADETKEAPTSDASVIQVSKVCTPERRNILTSAHPSFHAAVEIKYDSDTSSQKNSMDVVCVLDVSGSMNGYKLAYLKKAVEFVIDTLGERDRLSLVSFNNQSDVVHGLTRLTAANKSQTKRLVNRLSAGGGTCIFSGMRKGWEVLSRRRETQPSCMFLLTDGQDRSNTSLKMDLAKEIMNAGCNLMVFGFGADHDSSQMTNIANAAEGSFTYVETPDTVIDAFGGAIGSQQGMALRNVTLNIETRPGTTVNSISSGSYRSTVASAGRQTTTHYAQLYPGEQRTVLLNLSLASTDTWTSVVELVNQELFEVKISHDDPSGDGSRAMVEESSGGASSGGGGVVEGGMSPAICRVNRYKSEKLTEADGLRNVAVDAEINRLLATTAIKQAMEFADSGDIARGRKTVEEALATLRASSSLRANNTAVKALVEDLEEAMRGSLSDEYAFSSGGRACMTENLTKCSAQRSMYTKAGKMASYQSPSSSGFQDRATASKSKQK